MHNFSFEKYRFLKSSTMNLEFELNTFDVNDWKWNNKEDVWWVTNNIGYLTGCWYCCWWLQICCIAYTYSFQWTHTQRVSERASESVYERADGMKRNQVEIGWLEQDRNEISWNFQKSNRGLYDSSILFELDSIAPRNGFFFCTFFSSVYGLCKLLFLLSLLLLWIVGGCVRVCAIFLCYCFEFIRGLLDSQLNGRFVKVFDWILSRSWSCVGFVWGHWLVGRRAVGYIYIHIYTLCINYIVLYRFDVRFFLNAYKMCIYIEHIWHIHGYVYILARHFQHL